MKLIIQGIKKVSMVFSSRAAIIITLIFVLLFLAFSGNAYTEFGISKLLEAVLLIAFFFCSFLAFLFNLNISLTKQKIADILKASKSDNRIQFWTIVALFVIFPVFSLVMNILSDARNLTGILRLIIIYSSVFFIIVTYEKSRIIRVLLITTRILCILGLITYGLSFILPRTFVFEVYRTDNNTLVYNYYFLTYILKPFNYISNSIPRMNSIFWEPSIFAGFLAISLFIQLHENRIRIFDLLLYILCLALSNSTGGIILFAVLGLYYFTRKIKPRQETRYILLLGLLVILFFVFNGEIFNFLIKLSPSIFGKFSINNTSFATRFNSLPTFMKVYLEKPFFGYGPYGSLNRYEQLITGTINDSATSSFGFLISSFGLFGFLIVFFLFSFPFFLRTNFLTKMVASFFFFTLFNLQNVAFLSGFLLVPFLYIKEGMFQNTTSLVETTPKTSNILHLLKRTSDESLSVAKNINVALVIKSFSMLLGIISIPIYRSFFGSDDLYGVWMAILSILTWVLFFDLGLGYGLRSNLGTLLDEENYEDAKKMVSSTYVGSFFVSAIIFFIATIFVSTIDFNSLLNVPTGLITSLEIKISMIILTFGLCTEFVLKNIIFILYAKRRSALATSLALMSAIGLLSFFLIFRTTNLDNKLLISAIVYIFTVNVPLFVCTLIFFNKNRNISPKMSLFSKKQMNNIMSIGIVFFIIQICFMFVTQIDGFLITVFFSPIANVEYSYYSKIFVFFIGLMGAVVQQPIWSVIAHATVNKDRNKIVRYTKITFLIALLIFLICIIVGLLLQEVFDIWLGVFSPQVDTYFVLAFIIYSLVFLVANSLIIISNGLKILKPQLIVFLVSAIIKIPTIYLLKEIFQDISWILVILVDTIIYVPLILVLIVYIRRKLEILKNEQ